MHYDFAEELVLVLPVVINDSPQPHCPFEFGFININSDLHGYQNKKVNLLWYI
jgi:hypothetical protein